MIERAGNDRHEVVRRCHLPDAPSQFQQLTRPEQFVPAEASWKFHAIDFVWIKMPAAKAA
jgi:hypothetical protein